MTSTYLRRPIRIYSEAEWMSDHRNNTNTLAELLCWLRHHNAPERFSKSVDYAIERLHNEATERIKRK